MTRGAGLLIGPSLTEGLTNVKSSLLTQAGTWPPTRGTMGPLTEGSSTCGDNVSPTGPGRGPWTRMPDKGRAHHVPGRFYAVSTSCGGARMHRHPGSPLLSRLMCSGSVPRRRRSRMVSIAHTSSCSAATLR